MLTYGRLVTVSLNLHTTSDSGDGLLAGQVSNVDESVVEAKNLVLTFPVQHTLP